MKKSYVLLVAAFCALMPLYTLAASKTASWTGLGERSNVNDPGNWLVKDSQNQTIAGAVPDFDTQITISGDTDFNCPQGQRLQYSSIAIGDCRLTADCDWRGLTEMYLDVPLGAYLDTNFKPNQNTRVVMDVTVLGNKSTAMWFGCWDEDWNTNAFAVCNDANNVYIGYGSGTSCGGASPKITNGRHTIDFNRGVLTVDGTPHTTRSSSAFQLQQNLYLFTQNRKGTPLYNATNMDTIRFHSCQIYDGDDLVRNYVPTNNGSAFGLYDKANGTFHASSNANTPFTGALSSPEIAGTVDLAGHALLLADAKGQGTITGAPTETLANGYIDIPFGRWLDTEFKPNQNTRVTMDVTVGTKAEYWFGCWINSYDNGAFAVCNDPTSIYSGYGNQGGPTTPKIAQGRHTIDFNNGVLKVDGTTVKTFDAANFQLTCNLYLFTQNRNGIAFVDNKNDKFDKIRFHSCKIYDNGTLVRDYAPARTTAGFGVVEKLTGKFISLSGTAATGTIEGENTVLPGELHIDVASGCTVTNNSLAIAGYTQLVKDGAGTFTASKASQTYAGGTLVAAGRMTGAAAKAPAGIAESVVKVADGASFEWTGALSTTLADSYYSFNLAGTGTDGEGALVFANSSGAWNCYCLENLTLSADALVVDTSTENRAVGFIQGKDHILALNNHTLTIDAGSIFNFCRVAAANAGTVKFMTTKTGASDKRQASFWGGAADLSPVTFDMGENCILNINNSDGDIVFGTFIDRGLTEGGDNKGLIVQNVFKPLATSLHRTITLGNTANAGPVLDLSGLDAPFALPATGNTLKAASGATVYVATGDRKLKHDVPLVSWSAPPANVNFGRIGKGVLRLESDGLYITINGLMIIFK
ncbi:MAG: hypothetical protein J6P13_01505 [Kiritimatiellae bacterium]|nr:hypothetical protein [Kiritimatiellia bacterium]